MTPSGSDGEFETSSASELHPNTHGELLADLKEKADAHFIHFFRVGRTALW